jgi:coenzyme F420-0:L-glutamate ligase/coenzyme F420-1:gamma-L-glutamate ligase
MSVPSFSVWGVTGIPEIEPGDDIVALVASAIRDMGPEHGLVDGDILVVTSKIVSKAEGRQVPAAEREKAIADDTVRVVAERVHPGGVTRIVETRQGMIMAAAGLDMSNVPEGVALKLPEDPDRSARALCEGLREALGVEIGVIITDTIGRPWRVGQTDMAIGAAAVQLTDDLRGANDANGRPLHVTMAVVADELAGAADLVKGKTSGIPVAVVRGMGRLVQGLDAPGARTLVRTGDDDMFRFGSAEAYQLGYEAAMAEMRSEKGTKSRSKEQKQD